ncbi:MAG: hypothetical protein Q8P66_03080 [Candidatus Colwellbacteria bacterium]|nr:hypothetical protein [Candidatus Colwellbacteria bacterium]
MLGEALRTVCGPLGDLNQKLSGPNGEEWLAALKLFLRKENPWDGKPTFPEWKTVTLGTFKNVRPLKKALEKSGFQVSDWTSDILGKPAFNLATEKTEVNLVRLSVAELGFPGSVTLRKIYARAQKQGLNLCPAEVGPQLRLQYADQSHREWFTVAMEPIASSGGSLCVFEVGHDGDVGWLDAGGGSPDGFWSGEDQFVFVSPSTRA